MRLRILDRYIFQEVVFAFLFAICAFTAVFIGSGTLFRIARYITDYGASLSSVVKIFVYGLPNIIMWTFPMSMLLATLLTFGRLSSSSEITAMKSCGISFGRIAAPAIFLGVIVSICAILFNEHVVPWANTAYNNVVYYEIQGNTELKSQDHIIVKELTGERMERLIYAREYNAKNEILEGVTMQVFSEDGKVTHVENATFAEWKNEEWVMHDGMIYDLSDEQRTHTMKFDRQILPVKASPRQIVREQKKPEELTMSELKAQIEIMKSQYAHTAKLRACRSAARTSTDENAVFNGLRLERHYNFPVLCNHDARQCNRSRRSNPADVCRVDSERHRINCGLHPNLSCKQVRSGFEKIFENNRRRRVEYFYRRGFDDFDILFADGARCPKCSRRFTALRTRGHLSFLGTGRTFKA